jgi:hypothetical protein
MSKGSRWKYSQEIFLRLNYGKQTYRKMQKFMPERSEKAISNMAVKLGLSSKRNWNPYECIIALYYPNNTGEQLINRSKNALKIKKCRLIKSYLN